MKNIDWLQVGFAAGLLGFLPLTGWFTVLVRRQLGLEDPDSKPARYQVPEHLCSIDLVRSKVAIEPDGSVLATCCVDGCGCTVRLMQNMACAIVETPQ